MTLGKEAKGRIWCAPFRRDRRELMPLFRLADDSERRIKSYLYLGEVFVAAEAGQVLGHALIVPEEAGMSELKSIAVVESRQRQGIGSALVRAIVRFCRMQDSMSLRVTTAIADAETISFYLRHGFRAYGIVRDAFTMESGYPEFVGQSRIPLNDAIKLELVLGTASTEKIR